MTGPYLVRAAVMARTVILSDADDEPLLLLDPEQARDLAVALLGAARRVDDDADAGGTTYPGVPS